jgi:putative membrane protein
MSDPVPPSQSDRLAQLRTDLAGTRTAMAADRTLMAWIRTSLSMISFGFAIYKFLHGLTEATTIRLHRPNSPRDLGLFLTILGTGSLVAGIVQYTQTLRRVGLSALRVSVTFYVACAVVVMGLTVLIGIVSRIGPF